MKIQFKKLVVHPLFAGSLIMILGSNLSNVFSYLYHLVMGRMLGPSSYGELVAIISLVGLVSASFNFFGMVIVKFVSASSKKNLRNVFAWFDSKTSLLGLLVSIVLLFLAPVFARFLHLDWSLLILLSPLIYLNLKSLSYRSFLSGLLRFKQIVYSSNFDLIIRIISGGILVYFGFSVFGAVMGILISSFLTYLLLRFYLKDDISGKSKKRSFNDSKKVLVYTIPIFFSSLSVMSFFTTDILLVKHYFPDNTEIVGIYGALSNIGKIIFYSLSPVASVMFPMISKRYSQGKRTRTIFVYSSIFMLTGISVALAAYKFMPTLIISILFGNQYLLGSEYLFTFGLVMSIFSISNLVLNFYLSKEKIFPVVFVVLASLMQLVGIIFFHSGIKEVVQVSLYSSIVFMTGLIIYSLYVYKNQIKSEIVSRYSSIQS